MLSKVKDIPSVKRMLEKGSQMLGFDVLEKCRNTDEDVEAADVVQPIMFIAALAGFEKLRKEDPQVAGRASAMAGFSTGEYAALCAAGVFTFEEGLRLVMRRAKAGRTSQKRGDGMMLQILGLERAKVEQHMAQPSIAGVVSETYISGCLAKLLWVVSSDEEGCHNLQTVVMKKGAKNSKIISHVPDHSPHMKPAVGELTAALRELQPSMRPPDRDIYLNLTGTRLDKGTDPGVIIDILIQHFTSPILYDAMVTNMVKDGIKDFWEVGPGKQQTSVIKRIDDKFDSRCRNFNI